MISEMVKNPRAEKSRFLVLGQEQQWHPAFKCDMNFKTGIGLNIHTLKAHTSETSSTPEQEQRPFIQNIYIAFSPVQVSRVIQKPENWHSFLTSCCDFWGSTTTACCTAY